MKIGVVGAGHIGSVIAAELAHRNNDVIAIDVDSSKVGKINSGISPISEPGLADLISKVVAEKRLSATTEFSQLVNCELIIITVGTPYINGSADLSALKESARLIGLNASKDAVVVVKSTVPPGTTRDVILKLIPEDTFVLGFAPERLAEGQAINEFRSLPVVVGGVSESATTKIALIWESLGFEVIRVKDSTAAEMVKLADNAWIDLNIAFGHELAQICDLINTDVLEVIRAANSLKKGSSYVNILTPSVGVGGYCLTKDPHFLHEFANERGIDVNLSLVGRQINEKSPDYLFEKMMNKLSRHINPRILILGIAFKNDSGDLRFSPAVSFVEKIIEKELNFKWFDPLVMDNDAPEHLKPSRIEELGSGQYDVVACLASHANETDLSIDELAKLLNKDGIVIDGRRFFKSEEIKSLVNAGFAYVGVGRGV